MHNLDIHIYLENRFGEKNPVVLSYQRGQTDTHTDTQTDNPVFWDRNDPNTFSHVKIYYLHFLL